MLAKEFRELDVIDKGKCMEEGEESRITPALCADWSVRRGCCCDITNVIKIHFTSLNI